MLSYKNSQIAQNGILLSVSIWIIFDIAVTLGAIYAKYSMPDASSLNAYIQYALHILPNGLKGVFVAGIIATVFSTLDSFLFISSTTISHDILPKKFQNIRFIRQICIISIAIVSILGAIYVEKDLEKIWITIETYGSTAITIPFIMCLFFKIQILEKQFISAVTITISATIIYHIIYNDITSCYYFSMIVSTLVYICLIFYNLYVRQQYQK